MASGYTYVNTGQEVKNMWVHDAGQQRLVKIVYANNGSTVVHRASYNVTHNTPDFVNINPASPRVGKHGLTLQYNVTADFVSRLEGVSSTWGPGILQQSSGGGAEWTYTTPAITSDGSVDFQGAANYVAITVQPTNTTIYEGQVAQFSLTAVSQPLGITYQWQYKSGTSWINTGVNSSILNVSTINTTLNGRQYRCIVTSGDASATSNEVTLTVNAVTMNFSTEHTSIDEGEQKTWVVYSPHTSPVYWNIQHITTNNADFVSTQGSATVINNYASIPITTIADQLTEGPETFRVRAYLNSARTTLKATSSTCTIADTSVELSDPEPSLTSRVIDGGIVDWFDSGLTSYAGIKFLRSGQLQIRQGSSSAYFNVSGEWLNDIGTNHGDDFYIYVTGDNTTSNSSYNTNLRMNVAERYFQIQSTLGLQVREITIAVKDLSLNTIMTRTITLRVQVEKPGGGDDPL